MPLDVTELKRMLAEQLVVVREHQETQRRIAEALEAMALMLWSTASTNNRRDFPQQVCNWLHDVQTRGQ